MYDITVLLPIALLSISFCWALFRKRHNRGADAEITTDSLRPFHRVQPLQARLHFTFHAQQRMKERGVEREQIEITVSEPHFEAPDAKNNSVRLERDFSDRTLIVWVAQPWPTTQQVAIKTTAWTDKTIRFSIPRTTIGYVLGRGGATKRLIEDQHNSRIRINSDGIVAVSSNQVKHAESARRQILEMVRRATTSSDMIHAA